MSFRLIHGDNLSVLPQLIDEGIRVDAVVTDPPYGLKFMGKKWDYDVPSVELWQLVFQILKPGGHVLSFGGTRTYHRMVVNLEDAGFEIRDQLVWLYGSGFPKSFDISKAIQKSANGTPHGGSNPNSPNHGKYKTGCSEDNLEGRGFGAGPGSYMRESGDKEQLEITNIEAQAWQGWGTALKPAQESICVAYKPIGVSYDVDMILVHLNQLILKLCLLLPVNVAQENFGLSPKEYEEAFAFVRWTADDKSNIRDGLCGQMDTLRFQLMVSTCLSTVISWKHILEESWSDRNTFTIEMKSEMTTGLKTLKSLISGITLDTIIRAAIQNVGLWWNVSPVLRHFHECVLKYGDIQTPFVVGNAIESVLANYPDADELTPHLEPIVLARKPLEDIVINNVMLYGTGGINIDGCRVGTTKDVPASISGQKTGEKQNQVYGKYGLETGQESGHNPNIGRFPANVLLDESAAEQLDHQGGYTKSGAMKREVGAYDGESTTGFLRGRSGPQNQHGDEGGVSRFFYCAKASAKERRDSKHPTVKPLALMRYLCRLITPPGGIVLDPYAGSGATGEAALDENFIPILIEMEESYISDINVRLQKPVNVESLFS